MFGILADFNRYNFNDLKTASLELTHPIHASLPPAIHFHFHLLLSLASSFLFKNFGSDSFNSVLFRSNSPFLFLFV
jgi:hypothetical protein